MKLSNKLQRLTLVIAVSAVTVGMSAASAPGLALASAASAGGSSWSIQPTPNPTGVKDTELYGVSCASTGACTAVGSYVNGA